MKRTLLKSKIHMAYVTEANLDYYGSISIDKKLCAAANLVPFERVEIYNCNNGARFATYVILGEEGEICLNGAAARQVQKNDVVIIASYAEFKESELKDHHPDLVFVNDKNEIQEIKKYIDASINKANEVIIENQ
jgi:aspartate 1-decarboxylase